MVEEDTLIPTIAALVVLPVLLLESFRLIILLPLISSVAVLFHALIPFTSTLVPKGLLLVKLAIILLLINEFELVWQLIAIIVLLPECKILSAMVVSPM